MSRLIDADALKELFSEVIGSIAKKPEMNGNLEHMIRASAMVIQMIDDAPTVQPDIIRCKDCAYCDSDVVDSPYGMTDKVWWCDRLYAGANENLIVEPDDFCSWAERRE